MKKMPHVFPGYIVNVFFVIGLLAAVAFRAILILNDINPPLVRPIWYAGTSGYIIFFMYRYIVARKRKKAIADYGLIEKLKSNSCLTETDREVTVFLLQSLDKSRENLNYLFIFVFSLIAIIIDILIKI